MVEPGLIHGSHLLHASADEKIDCKETQRSSEGDPSVWQSGKQSSPSRHDAKQCELCPEISKFLAITRRAELAHNFLFSHRKIHERQSAFSRWPPLNCREAAVLQLSANRYALNCGGFVNEMTPCVTTNPARAPRVSHKAAAPAVMQPRTRSLGLSPQFSAQSASLQAGRSQEQASLAAAIAYSTVDV